LLASVLTSRKITQINPPQPWWITGYAR